MANASGKDAFYFPHDSNARRDNKILAMTSVYGNEGYGLYWKILEVLREQPDYKYPIRGKFALRSLAADLQCDPDKLESFVLSCCTDFADDHGGLLSMDENYLWSASFLRRMERVDDVREKRVSAARKRWGTTDDANALHLESKVKESKGKKRKEKQSKANNARARAAGCAAVAGDDFDLSAECETTVGELTGMQKSKLREYTGALGVDVVRMAIDRASRNGARTWGYVDKVLSAWLSDGLTTPEAVAEDADRFRSRRGVQQDDRYRPGEADQRAREDMERLREFMRAQKGGVDDA